METTTPLDSADVEAAYARYARSLRRVAYAVVRDHGAAEDCVHDVLARILAKPECFTAERGTLRTFLSVCVRNEAVARVRRLHRRTHIEATLRSRPVAHTFEIADYLEQARLTAALLTLPDEQYAAVELFYFNSFSHPQISKMLDVPLGTVKTRIKLAIKRLSHVFCGSGYEDARI